MVLIKNNDYDKVGMTLIMFKKNEKLTPSW